MSNGRPINYVDLVLEAEHLPTLVEVIREDGRYYGEGVEVGEDYVKAIGFCPGAPCIEWHVGDCGPRVTHKTGHVNYLIPYIEIARELHKKLAEELERKRLRALDDNPETIVVGALRLHNCDNAVSDAIVTYKGAVGPNKVTLTRMKPDGRFFATLKTQGGGGLEGSGQTKELAVKDLVAQISSQISDLCELRSLLEK